ncbi:MAG: PLP-dependent aspartate aminotransferase family protein [Candidatus Adiutrix intracellularis]|jgi:cystathionine gamma-synthase|nr:PLP-dependent aspartate aminotransferase family protein [Candidatus Adiutrix intracellularis]
MKLATICLHGARDGNNTTGALTVPIYQSATFAHPAVGRSTGYDYTRIQNPTRQALEELVTKLENGVDSLAFASGMAAMSALMELFNPNDHIVASNDLYGGSIRLFRNISQKNGLTVEYIDTGNISALKAALRPETRAVFIETPTNPMMKITDIAAVRSVLPPEISLIVDNTFLTPYFQRPLDLGADLVLHSGTKYLSGHNDTLAGFLIVADTRIAEKLREIYKTIGAILSPFDSFLVIRGLKTLPLRLEKSQTNAQILAEWLTKQPKVTTVYYPGLPNHPGREISLRQATGFGAMISFEVDHEETAKNILENIKLILYAESLGGVETLITYPILQTHADVPKEIRESLGLNNRLLRLSVGVEDVEDLIDDLSQALSIN